MAVIPRHELNVLMLTQGEAQDCAAEGKAADGYSALQAGLLRAIEFRDAGEPWGPALVGRWRESVELFAELHKIRME